MARIGLAARVRLVHTVPRTFSQSNSVPSVMLETERGSLKLSGSAASNLPSGQPGTPSANLRSAVKARYESIHKEREGKPDRITPDGAGLDAVHPSKALNLPVWSSLPSLTPLTDLIVLDKDKAENPRVSH